MATGGKMVSIKKLPLGCRLHFSDEDLVNRLKRKIMNLKEVDTTIPEFDIYKLPPWDLITKFNELSDLPSDGSECFFFHHRSNLNSERKTRKTKEGFWRSTGNGRKPQETDPMKWHKRYLVYHIGEQKKGVETLKSDWSMHGYEITSEPRIVVCRILHKIKPKKGKKIANSVSSEADPNGSPGTTACSKTPIGTPEISLPTSGITTTESQDLTLTSNINTPEYRSTSPKQTQIVAEKRSFLAYVMDIDGMSLSDLEDPLELHIFMREQSPCFTNALVDGSDLEDFNWSCPQDDIPEGGNVTPTDQSVLPGFISHPQHPNMMPMEEIPPINGNPLFNGTSGGIRYHQIGIPGPDAQLPLPEGENVTPTDQSVLPGFISHPQHPNTVPMEEIPPINGNPLLNGTSGGIIYHQLGIPGPDAQLPLLSQNYGAPKTNFEDAPQPTLYSLNHIPQLDSYASSPEELQMFQFSSLCKNILSSSDSSRGGSPHAFSSGSNSELQLTNLEAARDIAMASPAATQDMDIDLMLDFLLASPPPREAEMEESLLCQSSTIDGGYSTENFGVPYASGSEGTTTGEPNPEI